MNQRPLLSTIIVSYNTADLTCHCVSSVLNEYKHSNIDGEIIVVDNHSSDDSVKKLKRLFHDHIRLVENKENVGFAAGNNKGIRASTGKYIFLLNSDTVIHPGDIKQLLNVFQHHPDNDTESLEHTHLIDRVGIVSGRLENIDGTLQKQGGSLPNLWVICLWWLLPLPARLAKFPPQWSLHIEQDDFFEREQLMGWVGGTAMLLRREMIDEIGLLDEGIFMYAEDIEYCLRAQKHHWDTVYIPSTNITHFGSASSSSESARFGEIVGLFYVSQKHFPAWKAGAVRKILRLGCLLRLVLFGIILGNEKKKKSYQKAFIQLSPARTY